MERPRVRKQFHEPIQVVVVNTHQSAQSIRNNSDAMRQMHADRHVVREPKTPEREEGEWQESGDENGQEEENEDEEEEVEEVMVEEGEKQRREQHIFIEEEGEKEDEGEEEEEEEEEIEYKEDDEDDSDEENGDVPAKEVQGPKGSVIKVVPPKPRIASTVWARLNVKSEVSNNNSYSRSG